MNLLAKPMPDCQDPGVNKGELPFIRKPYQRNSKKLIVKTNSKADNSALKLEKSKSKELKVINSAKNRKKIDRKISSLIELGLIPDLPKSKLAKFKNSRKKSIMISDFMRKSSQKRILSFHKLDKIIQKTHDSGDKEKLPITYSFSVGLPSARNSQSFQVLPSLPKEPLSLNNDFKLLRETKLKKLDEIVGSCTDLLKSSQQKLKRLNSRLTISERSSL